MADTRGTFRLKNVRQDVLNNEYVSIPNVWIANDGFGYSMWANTDTLKKTNVNTGLASNGPTYPGGNGFSNKKACVSTPSIGYWMSGTYPGSSKVNKLTYSTETLSASVPNTSHNTSVTASISAGTKAYQFNGTWDGSSSNETMKMIYDTETWSNIPSTCPSNQWYQTGCNSGSETGYCHGGPSPSTPFYPSKMTFSNDTWSTVPGSGFVKRDRGSGKQRTPAHCWYSGGAENGAASSTTNKMTFASETWALAPSSFLPFGVTQGASYPYNGAKGAYVGGYGAPGPANSQAFTLSFATDTYDATTMTANSTVFDQGENGINGGTSAAENVLNGAIGSDPGVDGSSRWFDDASQSGPADVGYFRGWTTDDTSWVDKLDFNTETISAGTPTSNTKKSTKSACGDTRNGYLGDHPSASQGGTEKLDFNKDTWSSLPGANLYPTSNGGYNNGAAVSSPSKIYMTGWSSSGNVTAIETSTATSTEIPGSGSNSIYYATTPGSSARYYSAAAGNKTHGYFIGGRLSGPGNSESRVYKYTYSSETSQVTPGLGVYSSPGPGNNGINFHQASESSTAGYVIGGRQQPASPTSYSPSYIGKFPFATETYTQSVETWPALWGSIQQQIIVTGATKGYLFGEPSSSAFKFDYASDSGAVVPAMTEPRWPTKYYGGQGAMSSSDSHLDRFDPPVATPTNTTIIGTTPAPDVGYFTGGPHYSSTDKLNFTNDTMAAGAQMVTPRYNHVAWGNGTNFLDAGGTIANGADRDSRIEKITLSNNTVGALPGANMPNKKRFFVGATGNDNIGYIAGGQTPSSPGTSSILKITYATYTTDANPGCHLGAAGYTHGAGGHGIGSPTAAYIAGGSPSGSIGEGWHKIPYATNTATYTRPGQFDNPGAGRGDDQSTGNKDKGYVTGYNPGSFSTSKTTEVVFATDTASNSTYSPNLGYALNRGATGNQTTGYFHGGLPGPAGGAGNDSYITKFVYSSDTISQLPASGKMTVPRTHCDAGSGVENSHNLSANTALI